MTVNPTMNNASRNNADGFNPNNTNFGEGPTLNSKLSFGVQSTMKPPSISGALKPQKGHKRQVGSLYDKYDKLMSAYLRKESKRHIKSQKSRKSMSPKIMKDNTKKSIEQQPPPFKTKTQDKPKAKIQSFNKQLRNKTK